MRHLPYTPIFPTHLPLSTCGSEKSCSSHLLAEAAPDFMHPPQVRVPDEVGAPHSPPARRLAPSRPGRPSPPPLTPRCAGRRPPPGCDLGALCTAGETHWPDRRSPVAPEDFPPPQGLLLGVTVREVLFDFRVGRGVSQARSPKTKYLHKIN